MQLEVILPLVAYLVVVFGISVYAMRKRSTGTFLNEYFLGSRSMGGIVLAMTLTATYISASLCAVLPNIRIMEIDIDDVPWKDDLVTDLPEIVNGHMTTPTKPGWGTELNEEAIGNHLWENRSANW